MDTTGSGWRADVFATLGPGDDEYVGGPATDVVWSADEDTGEPQGSDTITTGGKVDAVITGSANPLSPDSDSIDLGAGDDELTLLGATDPARVIQGGAGADIMYLDEPLLNAPAVIDNATGTMTTLSGPIATWTSFSRFQLDSEGDYSPPEFIGGDGSESVESRVTLAGADLGGGNDELDLMPGQDPDIEGASLDGGDGTDRLFVHEFIDPQRVTLDLRTGALMFGRSDSPYAEVAGFELHDLAVNRLDFTGSAGPDTVRWTACHGSVSGFQGDDELSWNDFTLFAGGDRHCRHRDEPADISVYGNAGDDVLNGGKLNDILIGGAGDDTATGNRGEDRCQAETEASCEL